MLRLDIAYFCTKFDHSSVSCSIDMFGAYQILYCSRDLTTPLSGTVCRPRHGTCYVNLPIKFEVFICTHYEDMKSDTKCLNWSGLE